MSNQEGEDNMYAQDRKRAWEQRWATPGSDPFEQWFWTLQRYFNRKVDPEIMEIYRKVLGSIPVAELEAVFQSYIEQEDIPRDPPKAGQLFGMWKRRKEAQNAKREKRDKAKGQRDALDERDELRKRMFPLISYAIIGPSSYLAKPSDTPEWMRNIAQWTVDQMRTEHGDTEFHELTERQQQAVFDRGLELFDSERSQHEGQP